MSDTSKILELNVLSDDMEFRNFGPKWNNLLINSNVNNPFLTHEWQFAWWEEYGNDKDLFIVVVRLENQTIGIAPLMISRLGIFRILEFIGSGISDYLGFITHRDYKNATDEIINFLLKNKRQWDLINLKDVTDVDKIEKCLDSASTNRIKRVYEIAPYLEIKNTWDEFIKKKSKNSRKHLKYNLKKIDKLGDVKIIDYPGNNFSGHELVHSVWGIEKQSWKYQAGTAHFSEVKRRHFLSEILEKFADREWLDALLLKIDNKFVAYSIAFKYNSKIYNYEVGYRQDYPGAGNYLNTHHLRKTFEEGLKEYDFLRGNESYKLRWTKSYREVYQIVIYRSSSLLSLVGVNLIYKIRWRLRRYEWLHQLILKKKKIKAKFVNRLK
jgi:CelD/BcsL family acetyltransferase involved in cellulose biosynthesis